MTTRHLDLGCGSVPRNPYGRDTVFGVDLSGSTDGGSIRRANLALQPIPWPDDSFESVSAYDFLEHVPRVLPTADGQDTRFPFIELMNEIWRVLRPDGLFYASTPVYPSPQVFQDPTHVNALTVESHRYFTQPDRMAAGYGFHGAFALRRQRLYAPSPTSLYLQEPRRLRDHWRYARRVRRGEYSHVMWEFEAVKTAPPA